MPEAPSTAHVDPTDMGEVRKDLWECRNQRSQQPDQQSYAYREYQHPSGDRQTLFLHKTFHSGQGRFPSLKHDHQWRLRMVNRIWTNR
jgi:hypothetical protein